MSEGDETHAEAAKAVGRTARAPSKPEADSRSASGQPSRSELAYLRAGLDQPGGKLPLFDRDGQPIRPSLIKACVAKGWAERWFSNPLAPDWLVCRLTRAGVAAADPAALGDPGQAV